MAELEQYFTELTFNVHLEGHREWAMDWTIVELLSDSSAEERDFTFPTKRPDLSNLLRYGPRNVGAPGILIIWGTLKLIFFRLFRPTTGLEKYFHGTFPN